MGDDLSQSGYSESVWNVINLGIYLEALNGYNNSAVRWRLTWFIFKFIHSWAFLMRRVSSSSSGTRTCGDTFVPSDDTSSSGTKNFLTISALPFSSRWLCTRTQNGGQVTSQMPFHFQNAFWITLIQRTLTIGGGVFLYCWPPVYFVWLQLLCLCWISIQHCLCGQTQTSQRGGQPYRDTSPYGESSLLDSIKYLYPTFGQKQWLICNFFIKVSSVHSSSQQFRHHHSHQKICSPKTSPFMSMII